MVYKEGFIACCKVDGKILREDAGVVTLPFGCEYSILLKNLNSVRAQVKVSVDGTDATEGTWLIVPANGEIELERYIRNGNFNRGNKFKFIERTAGIEAHKGIGAADGLIRVEYKSEVVDVVQKSVIHHTEHVYHNNRPDWWWHGPYYRGPWIGSVTCDSLTDNNTYTGLSDQSITTTASNSQTVNTANMGSSYNVSTGSNILRSVNAKATRSIQASAGKRKMKSFTTEVERNDVGITVPGSESNQSFTIGPWFKTETTSHVIVLQLRGQVAGKAVKNAITVKSKAKCQTCGTVNKSSIKFCGNCGTSLALI